MPAHFDAEVTYVIRRSQLYHTQKLLISYAKVTYIIRRSYLCHTQKLLISYAEVTYIIRRSYLYHKQKLLISYAEVTYIIRRSYLYHTQKLIISYAEVTYIIRRSYLYHRNISESWLPFLTHYMNHIVNDFIKSTSHLEDSCVISSNLFQEQKALILIEISILW